MLTEKLQIGYPTGTNVIRIEPHPWDVMLRHALDNYPRECCGIMLGTLQDGDERTVTTAIACRNSYEGDQSDRFELDPKDQLAAQRLAREQKLEVLGFFHSHPDCDSYFSATDLANSWPWYSNVVISIVGGVLNQAKAFRANETQTESTEEILTWPQS
ncbi:Mov34/MPN/PAD-1 family protein [Paludibaculum fermentans]|uniref:Mov34/MPN/PAD-1 family protein n=1 Tax=Paludibaculum fermentans TaxID=1473598 RepID=UPI003EBE8B47